MNEELKRLLDYYSQAKFAQFIRVQEKDGNVSATSFMSGTVKSIDQAEGTIVHYISTPTIDHVNDVMNPFGMKSEALEKNRGVFFNHELGLPVGKYLKQRADKSGVTCWTKFAINVTKDDFAGDVFNLYAGGFLNSFSIGWSMKEWSWLPLSDLLKLIGMMDESQRFEIPNATQFLAENPADEKVCFHKTWGCHEYSAVGVPMNMDATVKTAMRKALDSGIIKSDFGVKLFGEMADDRVRIVLTDEVISSLSVSEKGIEVIKAAIPDWKPKDGEQPTPKQEDPSKAIKDMAEMMTAMSEQLTNVETRVGIIAEKQDQELALLESLTEEEQTEEEAAKPNSGTEKEIPEQKRETVAATGEIDLEKIMAQARGSR